MPKGNSYPGFGSWNNAAPSGGSASHQWPLCSQNFDSNQDESGGVGAWIDKWLLFNSVKNAGDAWGRWDAGQASGWEVTGKSLWAAGNVIFLGGSIYGLGKAAITGIGNLAFRTGTRLISDAVAGENLVHLTDEAGSVGIAKYGSIIGKHGIFAVPAGVAEEITAFKILRTGLTAAKTTEAITILAEASSIFRRPLVIGPYSAWKYFGGVHFALPGAIDTTTGVFSGSGALIGPGALIYGIDYGVHAFMRAGAVAYGYYKGGS